MNSGLRPTLIVVAGPNGSGKTSLTTKVLQHEWMGDAAYINPDNIARDRFGDWNSNSAVLQAAQWAERERERLLEAGKSMAFETVLSAPDKIDFIRRAKDAGYFVRLFFISTDSPTINSARVTQRVLEGGHSVDILKIVSRYSKSIANCVAAASFADRAYVYDNSIDGVEPTPLFRTEDGAIVKVYNAINEWAQVIVDSLPQRSMRAPTPEPLQAPGDPSPEPQ